MQLRVAAKFLLFAKAGSLLMLCQAESAVKSISERST